MFKRVSLLVTVLALLATMVPVMTGCAADDAPTEKAALQFIQFYDPECPFCQKMEPIVAELQDEYTPKIDSFEIVNITTDEGKAKVEEFGVFLTPTFVILDADGVELDRVTGATTKENMVTFIERGIADVAGDAQATPRETIDGEGTSIDADPADAPTTE